MIKIVPCFTTFIFWWVMAYTDTETQYAFCHYTDVKFSSAPSRERRGSFKGNELSLYPKHHSQSSRPPTLTSTTFTSVCYCSRSLTISVSYKSVYICNLYMYMYTYVYMDIYVYIYINSNKILYFRLPYVRLQNFIVLQINLWQINSTSVVQTTQLRYNVRKTSSTFLHRYYYHSSFAHSWELKRPRTTLRVCIYTWWPGDSLHVENKNVGTKRNR
jgi:hypothetical protein